MRTATEEASGGGPDESRLLVTVGSGWVSVASALFLVFIRFWRCVLAEDLREEVGACASSLG